MAERPVDGVRAAVARYGEAEVARWCADLILENVVADDPELPALSYLAGKAAEVHVQRLHTETPEADYWSRVWGMRGLLYAWHPDAGPAVITGLDDEHWRVREMGAKVARLRELGSSADALARRTTDETPRVRVAALRGLALVGEAEHAKIIRDREDDHERTVAAAAMVALTQLSIRLDRDLSGS